MSAASSSDVPMDSVSSPKQTAKYHTPICPANCDLLHHDLVAAMFMDGRYSTARIQRPGDLPIALKVRIEAAKLSGWDQDSEIPDPLEELRCPLLFLAGAFGKIGIVQGLLQNNFSPRSVNKHGDTALHFTIMHLNRAGAIIGGKLARSKDRVEAFERILHILTDYHPQILAAKDNHGRTVFLLVAEIILNRSRDGRKKKASFYQFCFKSMIKRLLELEDSAVFTRSEVTDIIKTTENKRGDSAMHMLARHNCGFEVLKFVQNLLFPGNSMADLKNNQDETVASLAWDTDASGAVKIFSLSPEAEKANQRLSQLECSADSMEHFEGSFISNDRDVSMEIENTDAVDQERILNPDTSADLATGNPFPELTVPLFSEGHEDDFHALTHSDTNVPCITKAYSLSDEDDLSHCTREASDSSKKPIDFTPNRAGTEESCSTEAAVTSSSKVEKCPDADNSFLEFVITEGIALDVAAKQNIVGVVLKQYLDKLDQVEERLPKLGQLVSEEETALDQKKEELALLKKEIDAKEKSLEELRGSKELLFEEKKKLKRKVAHCHATQQLLESSPKKGRSE